MTDNLIPDDIHRFILRNIDSIAQLEGLFILRSNPQKTWNAATLAQRLYIDQNEATLLMEQLASRGLIAAMENGSLYQYKPESAKLGQTVTRLAELYSRYLVPITHLIHSKPKNGIQDFANAFRIKKE